MKNATAQAAVKFSRTNENGEVTATLGDKAILIRRRDDTPTGYWGRYVYGMGRGKRYFSTLREAKEAAAKQLTGN